jgi:uncharacterized protein YkwD
VPAQKLLTRLALAAVSVAVLASPAAAHASSHPIASIALGDKRPSAVKTTSRETKKTTTKAAKKKSKKAKAHAAAITCANTDVVPTASNLSVVEAALLCLHNQAREAAGLPVLKENTKLDKAALGHSKDMVSEGYFDHTEPDGDTFVDRILGAGYAKSTDGWTLGENLAWGTGDLSTPAGMFAAWMNSAGHKANILKSAYQEIGFGIRLGVPSDDTVGVTVTADFGVKS